jgi:hypothetical protein
VATYVVAGVERVRLAPAVFTESAISGIAWSTLENIAEDSTAYTKNTDTITEEIPADKDTAFITFYAPGPADVITIGVLEQIPSIMNLLFNTVWTPATSKAITLAKRKIANLAIEITTRSIKDNRKLVIVLPNVMVTTTYVNNLNKTSVQQLLLTGNVGTFKSADNKDAISIKTWVTSTGGSIDDSGGSGTNLFPGGVFAFNTTFDFSKTFNFS